MSGERAEAIRAAYREYGDRLAAAQLERDLIRFADGDVVQLKSGGPLMTVQNDRADGYVHCYWFDGVTLLSEVFKPAALITEPAVPVTA